MKKIELLSPARNLEYGIEAIRHGADAVYIGGPSFGARVNALNNLSDIEKLVKFSHLYAAKVYVTLNTILFDNEIEEAAKIAQEVYNIGADALIIQDAGLLEIGLPPIPLHLSTQADNRDIEKIKFFENLGIQRVVLPRELSENQIQNIKNASNIELEAFVHGSLCVSYSGQCYLSEKMFQRSGNRGCCAQPCRLEWDLLSGKDKKVVLKNKNLLSIRDLNLSSHIGKMLDAGITSFKIEGRLKDLSYLKNVTAYYRQLLDGILEGRNLEKSSSGKVYFEFTPDINRTFNRQFTDYFITGNRQKFGSMDTPKSVGQFIGTVVESGQAYIKLADAKHNLHKGDGICFLADGKPLEGALVQNIEGRKITISKKILIHKNTKVFRNSDIQLDKLLSKESAKRKIEVDINLSIAHNQILLKITDSDGIQVEKTCPNNYDIAEKIQQNQERIKRNLGKLGNTIFEAKNIAIANDFKHFIPDAEINKLRRELIEELENKRSQHFKAIEIHRQNSSASYFEKSLDFRANVSNKFAESFYKKHGVETIEPALEVSKNYNTPKVLMRTKHCIRFEFDQCLLNCKSPQKWAEPLEICRGKEHFLLRFDCKKCEMEVISHQ